MAVFLLSPNEDSEAKVQKEVQKMELINKYETVFVVNPELSEEDTQNLIKKFTDLIAQNGTIENINEWGKRKLAYPIDDYTEGYYVVVNFTAAPAFPAELCRIYNITDGILRSIVVRPEK